MVLLFASQSLIDFHSSSSMPQTTSAAEKNAVQSLEAILGITFQISGLAVISESKLHIFAADLYKLSVSGF